MVHVFDFQVQVVVVVFDDYFEKIDSEDFFAKRNIFLLEKTNIFFVNS